MNKRSGKSSLDVSGQLTAAVRPGTPASRTTDESETDRGDTVRMKAPRAARAQAARAHPSVATGVNPYSTADERMAVPKEGRRTLDDMRRLSEEIKRTQARRKLPR